jgi:hypothetical protein
VTWRCLSRGSRPLARIASGVCAASKRGPANIQLITWLGATGLFARNGLCGRVATGPTPAHRRRPGGPGHLSGWNDFPPDSLPLYGTAARNFQEHRPQYLPEYIFVILRHPASGVASSAPDPCSVCGGRRSALCPTADRAQTPALLPLALDAGKRSIGPDTRGGPARGGAGRRTQQL